MAPNKSPVERRRKKADRTGYTKNTQDFHRICKKHQGRVGIIAEGDSWFAFPGKFPTLSNDINIVHHIKKKISGTRKANLLQLSSNGDEAVDMLSGKQKRKLMRILKKNQQFIKIILFSGGGNDIVGKNDMPPLLKTFKQGFSARDCINIPRLNRKLEAVILAYSELIDMRDEFAPNAVIITHTYDIAKPVNQGAEFVWGLIKTKPWIFPYLKEKGIPKKLHLAIVEFIFTEFKQRLDALANLPENRGKFIVVDTQRTLRPGSKNDWLNEIHPTSAGFKKITKKVYAAMKRSQPGLPKW